MIASPNVAIPASDFYDLVVQPTLDEFIADSRNFRKAVIALWAVAALIEHICWEKFPTEMQIADNNFLDNLALQQPGYAVIREASNCLKHAVRRGKNPKTAGSASVKIRERSWGDAGYGTDEWGGTPVALVDYIDGQSMSLIHAMQTTAAWIKTQLEQGQTLNTSAKVKHTRLPSF